MVKVRQSKHRVYGNINNFKLIHSELKNCLHLTSNCKMNSDSKNLKTTLEL